MKKLILLIVVFFSVAATAQDRFTILEEKLVQAKKNSAGLEDKIQMSVNAMSMQDFLQGIAINHNKSIS